MAESFNYTTANRVGETVILMSDATIGAGSTFATGTVVGTGSTVDNLDSQYILGSSKFHSDAGGTQIYWESTSPSTNTATVTNQTIRANAGEVVHTASLKSLILAGTFANLTRNRVEVSVEIRQEGQSTCSLADRIPVPAGSSFVISDVGKITLLQGSEVVVYCNADNALDVTLSLLEGVN